MKNRNRPAVVGYLFAMALGLTAACTSAGETSSDGDTVPPATSETSLPVANSDQGDPLGDADVDDTLKRYCSSVYGLALVIPQEWEMTGGVRDEYVKSGRLLQIGAIGGEGLDLAEIVDIEILHSLQPYGTNPSVSFFEMKGADAALVIPSDDAPGDLDHPATGILIVKPDVQVAVGEARYGYITVRFDQASSEYALTAELSQCFELPEDRAA